MKYIIFAFVYIFAFACVADASWQDKTKENLDFLYTHIKKNHPKIQDPSFHLGKAYGVSLDKVKQVTDETQFYAAVRDFAQILDDVSVVIVKKTDLNPHMKPTTVTDLPYGDLVVAISEQGSTAK